MPVLEGYDVVVSPAYGPAWKSDLVNGDNAKYVSAVDHGGGGGGLADPHGAHGTRRGTCRWA